VGRCSKRTSLTSGPLFWGTLYPSVEEFIGLILWEVTFNGSEDWYFHKVDKAIINEYNLLGDIQVIEYFRCDTLPARTR